MKWPRRRIRIVAAAVAAVPVLVITAAGVALRVEDTGRLDPQAWTRGRDAVWLGHAWVDGRRTDADVGALARRLRGSGVHDLFVHAGPLEGDGSLPAGRYANAAWMLSALHTALPGVRVVAWLGQVVGGAGGVDLGSEATRVRIEQSAAQVLAAGFGGVHYDFEPAPDGGHGLLDVLDRTRAVAHARGAVVSVAVPQVAPLPGFTGGGNLVVGHPKWWPPDYLHAVASRVDQVAVMSYDTALPLGSLYAGYVRRQTEVALAAVPQSVDLLMGIPAYHTDDMGHWGSAETVAAAIRGVRLGLGRDHRDHFGVALYADFAATGADWSAYLRAWGTPPAPAVPRTRP